MDKFLKIRAVIELTGLSRSTIYLKIKLGQFPRPIKLGFRSVAFSQSEIAAWMEERVSATRNGCAV
jgi:prophage regulatory protein